MIMDNDKINLIQLKIDFFNDRLNESIEYKPMLEALGNELKIEGNNQDIINYTKIIELLNIEKETLTNQG